MVSSLSAARAVLLVLLAILLFLLFLHRSGSTVGALCCGTSDTMDRKFNAPWHKHTALWNKLTGNFTWWVFKDERAEFVSGVKHATISTGLTGVADGLFLRVDMLEER